MLHAQNRRSGDQMIGISPSQKRKAPTAKSAARHRRAPTLERAGATARLPIFQFLPARKSAMSDNAAATFLAAHRHPSLRRAATAVLGIALLAAGVASARAAALDEAAENYRAYMIKDVEQSLAGAKTLQARVNAKDLGGAQEAWIQSRVGWERSEVFTSGFVPDLDEKIDAWPNALTGFHAVEAKLFGAKDVGVQEQADVLVFYLSDLDVKVRNLRFDPQGLLNGVARLAYEVGENKSDGGESPFSGTSLDDMRYNAYGIQSAY
ncbi:MAG TPA: EfeM/EfeO family lipoprotein, partial [Candidatus Sulfotelmatobacter sp.]|nr:EfeM/EfeO family lipoprotein [Candidatus Sulfotelmatobacter sp.]